MSKRNRPCDCSDPGCPVPHAGFRCNRPAGIDLARIDMDDSGQAFCEECAADALDSGVFAPVED